MSGRCNAAFAVVLAMVAVLAFRAIAAEELSVVEPDDYRTDAYLASTPETLKGARVVTTDEAHALWAAGTAAFVDVLPRPPRPRDLPAGTIWRDKPRRDIPGSVWLPDTGYGELADVTQEYLRAGLARVSGDDSTKALVFYCLKDCWMSWNAAKRALEMGYRNVVWYPDGTDGWQAAGFALTDATPAARE
jgi:PQQ-dependent catabolism-associated CXXCW motif protein